MSKTTKEIIIEGISEYLDVDKDKISLQDNLVDDLGADSLDQIELVMAAEEQFGIEIPNEHAEKLITVNDCVEYIEKVI